MDMHRFAAILKRHCRQLCPPVCWDLASRARQKLPRARPRRGQRVATTLEELDREIARADEAAKVSDDELRRVLGEFCFARPKAVLPADPHSREYFQAQFALYRLISGRATYQAATDEMTVFDKAEIEARPFPYSTRSSTTVGEQLMAIGFTIQAMALRPGHRVLEFGPGWGKMTIELTQMGQPVTAVDINPDFLDLIKSRCGRLGCAVTTACSDMLRYSSTARFERVLFYECFHHCADHVAMIKRLDDLLTEDGVCLFAGEPITDEFSVPWGVRLDGASVWSIRKFGWLELGFRTDYFLDLLRRHHWKTEVHNSRDVSWQRVFVARRAARGPLTGPAHDRSPAKPGA
jgi:2-polyprenyl-3-methyl-5-hydroxy-6-metoxy-1,4-benzoquinol methylase